MCDDAFITVRAVQNLLAGRCFAFNGDERVMGFTSPPWAVLLIVPRKIASDPFFTPMLLNAFVAMFGAWLLVYRTGSNRALALLAAVLLAFSRAFVDFSTSGLENSLIYAMLGLFAIEVFRERPRLDRLGLWASLLWATRMDSVLIGAPCIV